MTKRTSMRLIGGALACGMAAAPALAQLAPGQTVLASPSGIDTGWQTCTVAGAPNVSGWYPLNCGGGILNVDPRWISAAAPAPQAGPQLPGQPQAGAYPPPAPQPGGYAPAPQGGYAQVPQAAGAYPVQAPQAGYGQAPASAYPAAAPQQAVYNQTPPQAPAAPPAAPPAGNPFGALATALGAATSGGAGASGNANAGAAMNAIAGAIGAFGALANATQGTQGQAAAVPQSPAPAQYPAQAQQVAMAGPALPAQAAGPMPAGVYECWGNGQAAMALNFSVTAPGQYRSTADGTPGTFQVNPANNAVTFTGLLGNATANGFSTVYHANGGIPTLSFVGQNGAEAAFCQRV